MSFAALNICSVTKKVDNTKLLLAKSNLDYLTICKSWVSDYISKNEITIEDYDPQRFDHQESNGKSMGGSLLVYTKSSRDFTGIPELNLCNEDAELM